MGIKNRDLHLCIDHVSCANTAIKLYQGEVLEGEVMPFLSDGVMALKIKDTCIPLRCKADLMPGDRVILAVVKLEPKVTFRLLYKKGLFSSSFEVSA
jgi:hypothetical protein